LLEAVLAGLPRLPGARCRDRYALFDSVDDDDHAHAAAICRSCPALAQCRNWAQAQPDGALRGRSLRAALPEDLSWVTPHSFRRTVATMVRDAHGPALAQQQLSHATLATTEAHYLQRNTRGPDVRDALERYADGG
jgi:integrase